MTVFSPFPRGADDALIRPLTKDDRAELETMIETDPVGFLFAAEHLHHFGLPAPSALTSLKVSQGFMGVFVPREIHPEVGFQGAGSTQPSAGLTLPVGERLPAKVKTALNGLWSKTGALVGRSAGAHFAEPNPRTAAPMPGLAETFAPAPSQGQPRYALVGAFWLGANCVPLTVPQTYHRQVAAYIWRHNRKIGSIFGHQEPVMGIWSYLAHRMPAPFDVRKNQPLLELPVTTDLSHIAGATLARPSLGAPAVVEQVRWARTDDRPSLIQASVSMFTEEVGYDPMTRDPAGYTRRVDELTRTGRTLVAVNSENVVVFKTDVGLAHGSSCQLQGVWLHPSYRGQRLAPVLLAQACQLIRQRFPHLSLYVNDYNAPASALYAATGWKQRSTFATVLF
ncbi:MAG: GNAT family N-acetyltransferase [Rothia sp. (in: high G+C Gram-positive bacteria)]|nr:GNAT family N-acetyltransferase [Rothia sp. (in: high G+C Gram-positive bacteria)]